MLQMTSDYVLLSKYTFCDISFSLPFYHYYCQERELPCQGRLYLHVVKVICVRGNCVIFGRRFVSWYKTTSHAGNS